MGNVSPTPRQLLVEAAIFWSIGTVLYVGRMISRLMTNMSLQGISWDDYVMTATFLFYTSLLVLIQVSAKYATNLMGPDEADQILADPKQVHDRILGSKINLPSRIYVKILSVYVALGFAVIMITYYAVYCRPFSQYWAMPVSNAQCATYQHYSITQAVFNISSDAFMFAIPIPLIVKAKLPRRRKFLLLLVMSLGLFTIIAAILNKYFNFASPLTTVYQIWYIREASTAIFVANMMCWWPLLRKLFGMKAFQYISTPRRSYRKTDENNTRSKTAGSHSGRGSFSVTRAFHRTKELSLTGHSNAGRSSQEAINRSTGDLPGDLDRPDIPLQVWGKGNERGGDVENLAVQEATVRFEKSSDEIESPRGNGIYCTTEFNIREDVRGQN
ncbi:hypothetical protein N7533_011861 [Penicillium manginii]|uniref:uncharacterized protein n=1 Tax=Penicillium manginii TaxID=203109 RepID=UPI0025488551|nr:uncharacterized protein N7533_011861 [Penicillium manginii]KAJ5739077.1 hypothetical protein N7533_011861 [Penicillium manginii]